MVDAALKQRGGSGKVFCGTLDLSRRRRSKRDPEGVEGERSGEGIYILPRPSRLGEFLPSRDPTNPTGSAGRGPLDPSGSASAEANVRYC